MASKLLLFGSIILAFVLPGPAKALSPLLIPVLIVMMVLSTKDVVLLRVDGPRTARLIAFNSFLLGGAYMLMAYFFIAPEHRAAIYVLALMPPAVGVVALSRIFNGDTSQAFMTEFFGYLVALIVVPVGTLILFGDAVNPLRLIATLLLVVVVPFLLSRIVRRYERKHAPIHATPLIHLCYAITFYIIVGMNIEAFSFSLLGVFFVLLSVKVVMTLLFSLTKDRVLNVLFGSFKNGGAAVAIVVLLFGVEAALPLAINGAVVPLHILLVERVLGGDMDVDV